jgi:hypothetical protein
LWRLPDDRAFIVITKAAKLVKGLPVESSIRSLFSRLFVGLRAFAADVASAVICCGRGAYDAEEPDFENYLGVQRDLAAPWRESCM